MTKYLFAHDIRIFDYARFAKPLRHQIRDNAKQLAREHNLKIGFVRSPKIRKEELIRKMLDKRGHHPRLVHNLSAMELRSDL